MHQLGLVVRKKKSYANNLGTSIISVNISQLNVRYVSCRGNFSLLNE